MASPVAPKNQTPFDDEISLLDIIQFFKTNFKRILFYIILGGILGYLYGKLTPPVYDGSVLISPSKIGGNLVVDPKITLTELNMNSYYSKNTFLACNPMFYKDKDKDKDYDISDIVKASISQDGNLIELSMISPDKEKIHACLENILNDINANQKTIADPIIEFKKIELNLLEKKLKLAEEFHEQINDKQIKNLRTNELGLLANAFHSYLVFNNNTQIKTLLEQISKAKMELSSVYTKEAGKVLPINIERKKISSPQFRLILGLFLGFCVGVLIGLIKQMKI